MEDWNLKQLVSILVIGKERVRSKYYEYHFLKETKNIFGRIKYKEGFYFHRGIGEGFDKNTYSETCPEGYVFENGVVYYDNSRVVLNFVDGSKKGIKVGSLEEGLKLKEDIIKDCGKDFKKLKL